MNFDFLKSNAVKLFAAILLLQGVVLLSYQKPESVPPSKPLREFPTQVSGWKMVSEGVVEKEVQDVLQADDLLNRNYQFEGEAVANLFVAAFRSQRNGKAPHSPKNCLPGSGWVQQSSTIEMLPVEGGKQIEVNRYLVGKGDARSLVYYWYQSRDRSVANEYTAKYYVVRDAISLNRTDTALVRVVVGVPSSDAVPLADKYARDLIAKSYPHLSSVLPQ